MKTTLSLFRAIDLVEDGNGYVFVYGRTNLLGRAAIRVGHRQARQLAEHSVTISGVHVVAGSTIGESSEDGAPPYHCHDENDPDRRLVWSLDYHECDGPQLNIY